MRRGGSVSGAVSLVMIFCVLCLAVFAALTYVTADRERQLAELAAQRAAEYYAADAEAARIVAALSRGETPDADVVWSNDGYSAALQPEGSIADFGVPINDTQELHVTVKLFRDGTYEIRDWSTAYAGDWETNDTIDIWDGDF